MKHLTTSQRLLLAVLLVALAAWAFDGLTRDTLPQTAQAASPPPETANRQVVDWQNVRALANRLTETRYQPAEERLAGLTRDLFVPAPDFLEALIRRQSSEEQPALTPEAPEEKAAAEAPEKLDFAAAHRLDGVLIGPGRPLAVIDGRLVPLLGLVDVYRLVEIQRDYVVFQSLESDERVILTLSADRPNEPVVP